jgi:hypothetical protein
MRTSPLSDPVTVSITTLPDRVSHLRRSFESIYPQADRVNVYLDGHTETPAFLRRPGVHVEHSNGAARSGNNKFRWGEQVNGYHVYADDDLIYPEDYVEKIVTAIERYDRAAVVGVLGIILRFPLESYAKNRVPLTLPMPLPWDARVHVLGTGTMAHHTDTIRFTLADYPTRDMADVWSAIKAKRSGIPMFAIARPPYWLGTMRVDGFAVSAHFPVESQTRAIVAEAPWPELPLPRRTPTRNGWPYRWIAP